MPTRSLLLSQYYYPPSVGGISHMMARVADELGAGRVCVLTGVRPERDAAAQTPDVPTYRAPRGFEAGRIGQVLLHGPLVGWIALHRRVGALQLATAYEGGLGLELSRVFRWPMLIYAHGNEILAASREPEGRPMQALREAACVVANSRYTAGLLRDAGVIEARIAVIHPGCDVDVYRPMRPDPALARRLLGDAVGAPVILTVGNLVERKGHDQVIRALPRVLERVPEARYLIVGDGVHRAALERQAREVGVAERVVFAGRVAEADLPGCHALADVFVMPSRARIEHMDVEGFGIVYLEAAACERPVVAGRSGGVPDAVADGDTGILVDEHDPGAIADALVGLMLDPDRAQAFGRRGRERVLEGFTWRRFAESVQSRIDALRCDD